MSRYRPVLGDVFAFPIARGTGLLHLVGKTKDYGEIVRAFATTEDRRGVCDVVSGREAFATGYLLEEALRHALVERVANCDATPWRDIRFRYGHENVSGRIVSWREVRLDGSERNLGRELTDEQRHLSLQGLATHAAVVGYIDEGYTPFFDYYPTSRSRAVVRWVTRRHLSSDPRAYRCRFSDEERAYSALGVFRRRGMQAEFRREPDAQFLVTARERFYDPGEEEVRQHVTRLGGTYLGLGEMLDPAVADDDRPTMTHYAYFASADAARAAAKALRDIGIRTSSRKEGEESWSVTAAEEFDGDITASSNRVSAIVEQHGGDYDGHEVGPL